MAMRRPFIGSHIKYRLNITISIQLDLLLGIALSKITRTGRSVLIGIVTILEFRYMRDRYHIPGSGTVGRASCVWQRQDKLFPAPHSYELDLLCDSVHGRDLEEYVGSLRVRWVIIG